MGFINSCFKLLICCDFAKLLTNADKNIGSLYRQMRETGAPKQSSGPVLWTNRPASSLGMSWWAQDTHAIPTMLPFFFFFFLLLLCSRRQATSFIFISPFLSFSAWIQGEICSGDTGACVSCQQGSNSSAATSRRSPNTDTSASVLSSSLSGVYVAVCTWQTSYGSHQDFKLG